MQDLLESNHTIESNNSESKYCASLHVMHIAIKMEKQFTTPSENPQRIIEHAWKYGKLEHKSPGVPRYKCEFCNYHTKREIFLNRHVALHINKTGSDETFNCALCKYKAKTKNDLICHMETHPCSFYECSTCPYKSKWKSSLRVHEAAHQRKYKCDECEFVTNKNRFLRQHKAAHRTLEEVQFFHCDKCEYRTRFKQGLKNHMFVHKSEKEIKIEQCPRCARKFKRVGDLRKHVLMTHSDFVTVYNCEHCSYRTKYKNNLRMHENRLHSGEIKTFRCKYCSFKTIHQCRLQSHVVSQHTKSEDVDTPKYTESGFSSKTVPNLLFVEVEKIEIEEGDIVDE